MGPQRIRRSAPERFTPDTPITDSNTCEKGRGVSWNAYPQAASRRRWNRRIADPMSLTSPARIKKKVPQAPD